MKIIQITLVTLLMILATNTYASYHIKVQNDSSMDPIPVINVILNKSGATINTGDSIAWAAPREIEIYADCGGGCATHQGSAAITFGSWSKYCQLILTRKTSGLNYDSFHATTSTKGMGCDIQCSRNNDCRMTIYDL